MLKLKQQKISIHAPLAGCDERGLFAGGVVHGISIHAPLAGCDFFFAMGISLS